jgi:hypothetical protein
MSVGQDETLFNLNGRKVLWSDDVCGPVIRHQCSPANNNHHLTVEVKKGRDIYLVDISAGTDEIDKYMLKIADSIK